MTDNPDTAVVRYGEIFLKSPYVRNKFTSLLAECIKDRLKRKGISAKVKVGRHRLFLSSDSACDAAYEASRVFGVKSSSPAYLTLPDFESISHMALSIFDRGLEGKTFAVRAKRSPDYPIKSQELERLLGAEIASKYANKVNLSRPDVTLGVEASVEGAYLFTERFEGMGGLPYGSQGSVLALVEDRLDATAAFMLARRGCTIAYVGVQKYYHKISDFTYPYMKKYTNIAEAIEKTKPQGIVVGETIEDADHELDKSQNLPVFRPLYALPQSFMEKMEAISGI
jgi:tRNA uracil 4-sulfurtransferase